MITSAPSPGNTSSRHCETSDTRSYMMIIFFNKIKATGVEMRSASFIRLKRPSEGAQKVEAQFGWKGADAGFV